MIKEENTTTLQQIKVNKAFTRQSAHYDEDDKKNPILADMRGQVREHVEKFLNSGDRILELNAGTGLDAIYFAGKGHRVHATDLSDGMIEVIKRKINDHQLYSRLTCQQCSYDQLDELNLGRFDYLFSNFGGLNCIRDLDNVTRHFTSILKKNGYATIVVMPMVSLWELLSVFKGNTRAFRRFNKNGTMSHLEGEYFTTYYHTLSTIVKAFGPDFQLLKVEGLGAVMPPPHKAAFPKQRLGLYRFLKKLDGKVRGHFPFNRWADHIITTFQFVPQ